jgi:dipeptidyl-peptidase-4
MNPLPVILDPYGGPHAQRVLKANNPHLVSRWLAEQGYAVLVTDGRGTPGRGPAWEREVYGNLADPVLDDQLSALDAALEHHDFLDPSRVGIRGWSFGGFLAALAVLRRPDRFHAAIAGAPVTSWQLYDTHYTERYLGHPKTEPQHNRQSKQWNDVDPVTLERPLLLIHGLADDNVVAAHTLRFSTELLANGCAHQVLPLSGVTHMTPQEAVTENLLRLQLRFFDDTIGRRAR